MNFKPYTIVAKIPTKKKPNFTPVTVVPSKK